MVHISDGVLLPEVLAAGWLITIVILAVSMYKIRAEEIPKLSVVTAAFFVASLVHVPIGPTYVHLILNGLIGVIVGQAAYVSIFIGVVMQAFLFGHGGITTIGVNTMNMGLPALAAYWIFKFGCRLSNTPFHIPVIGCIAGASAVILALILTAVILMSTGKEFVVVAIAFLVFHIPIVIIEGMIVGSVVGFLKKVKPEVLNLNSKIIPLLLICIIFFLMQPTADAHMMHIHTTVITEEPKITIHCKAYFSGGKPVEGGVVKIYSLINGNEELYQELTTDENGRFNFSQKNGTYRYKIVVEATHIPGHRAEAIVNLNKTINSGSGEKVEPKQEISLYLQITIGLVCLFGLLVVSLVYLFYKHKNKKDKNAIPANR